MGQRDTRVSVLIDSDFDFLLGNIQTCTLIISTDYANMEMYFYNIQGLGKLLTLLIGNFPKVRKRDGAAGINWWSTRFRMDAFRFCVFVGLKGAVLTLTSPA